MTSYQLAVNSLELFVNSILLFATLYPKTLNPKPKPKIQQKKGYEKKTQQKCHPAIEH
jgi:hypothetical protein